MPPSKAQTGNDLADLRGIKPTARDEQLAALQDEETRLAKAAADEQEDRNKKRYAYANIFVGIAVVWLTFTGALLIASGLDKCPISISDRVMMVLLGTATVNVLAPAVLLAKYLFSNRQS